MRSFDPDTPVTDLTPLTFDPVIVPKPWGGRRLESYGKTLPDDGLYGESWEVADLPPESVASSNTSRAPIVGGDHAGRNLRSLIESHGSDLLGMAQPTADGDFPLLVKLLDAREHLSVQVHPTDEYVATHEGCWLKTESWYVVDAEPHSVIYKGFKPGVTIEDVEDAAGRQAFVDLMRDIPAVPGDFHHLPAGIIHALGAGVLVAEPQTPSDTTFRMYDWTEEYGREPRDLHLQQGIETLTMEPEGAVALPPMAGDGDRMLVETPHYWQREHRVTDGPVKMIPGAELRILMVVRGGATVTGPGSYVAQLTAGSTVVIPAILTDHVSVDTTGSATVIETGLV